MKCLFPLSVKNPKTNKYIPAPCGKCAYCLGVRRSQWSFRLQQELKAHHNAFFITLTYNDDYVPTSELGFQTLKKKDVQDFIKRLRARLDPLKVRYYAVGEYGSETLRPHYHMILFGLPDAFDIVEFVRQVWKQGNVMVDPVTDGRIGYITKYMIKDKSDLQDRDKEFSLMSRKPALGSNYLTPDRISWHMNGRKKYCVVSGGAKVGLPRYYKEKIFQSKIYNDIDSKANIEREDKAQNVARETFTRKYPNRNFFKDQSDAAIVKDTTLKARITKKHKL